MKEHLKEVMDKPKDQMTEEELEFHYFKLHDYDDNNKLDGVEIVKAITHFHAGKKLCLSHGRMFREALYYSVCLSQTVLSTCGGNTSRNKGLMNQMYALAPIWLPEWPLLSL